MATTFQATSGGCSATKTTLPTAVQSVIPLAFGGEIERIHSGAVDQPGVFELCQSLADVTRRDLPEHFVRDQ